MTTPAPQTGRAHAFLRPGGFTPYDGGTDTERTRFLRLTGVFLSALFDGAPAKLGAAVFLLPAVGYSAYAIVRTQVQVFAVPAPEQTAFLLSNLAAVFAFDLGWLMLAHAGKVAPLIARDASQGALLLYFSRPVQRPHYLYARLTAVTAASTAALALPVLLTLVVHLASFGPQLGGATLQGWMSALLWLGAALVIVVAAAASAGLLSLVSLAAGAAVRNPTTAPLLLGGGILGSLALSWILQAAWGRETVARSVDLHHALGSFHTVGFGLLQPDGLPRFALVQAGLGVTIWVGLAVGAWWLLQRFLANPPLGRGRS
jgi:hypothetical protein